MTQTSDLRTYLDTNHELPADCVLGHIAWFTVEDAQYDAKRLVDDFDRLNLNTGMLPPPIKPDDAFEKATKEIDRFKYSVYGGNTAEILIREVGRDVRTITRHMIREVKDQSGRRLLYDKVGELVFYKGQVRNGVIDQGSVRVSARLDNNLSVSEHDVLTPVVTQFEEAYARYRDFHDGQKIRGVMRNYLVFLNAVAMKPSVYFVHSSRADELERLKEFADGLPTCSMMLLPQPDLPALRQDIIDAFAVEAEKDLASVVTEIAKLRATRKGNVRPEAFAKVKGEFDRVMRKANEYGRTLQISQDRTAGAAELAVDALMALQSDVLRSIGEKK